MLAITGHTLDLLRESLDCLYPNDLVEDVRAYRREYSRPGFLPDVWYDVQYTLYNMADNERVYFGEARVDLDECVTWSRHVKAAACG